MRDLRNLSKNEQEIAALRDSVETMAESIPYIAKLYREYYNALLKEGFTEKDAVYLIGVHGITLGLKNP